MSLFIPFYCYRHAAAPQNVQSNYWTYDYWNIGQDVHRNTKKFTPQNTHNYTKHTFTKSSFYIHAV